MTRVIAIEGITKCGKTTQCELLQSKLNKMGKKTQVILEFATSAIGKLAEQLAFNQVVAENAHAGFLLFVANDWEKSAKIDRIAKDLKNNIILIDGFIEQVLVYESDSLKMPLNPKTIKLFYNFFEGLPAVPDLSLILQPSWSEVSERLENGNEEHFKNAYENFKILSKQLAKKSNGKTEYRTINIEGMTKQQVTQEILTVLNRVFPNF
jgi:thymidylate kinase